MTYDQGGYTQHIYIYDMIKGIGRIYYVCTHVLVSYERERKKQHIIT